MVHVYPAPEEMSVISSSSNIVFVIVIVVLVVVYSLHVRATARMIEVFA